ncbi:hypothetical protein KGQ20_13735 [Catenulispora sp. NF23]|uniref:hypothetical protein n=1 Tax=Catenulispora pinistramenti TaxID=2705254 RepID=UPI001BAC6457|nr:hypothetical protein [Catenulispora pinistramenti]MBS2533829.1 hypothetical protein [Catenulispora pinistramenti]
MPYLGQITIAGPEPEVEVERRQHFVDALSAAVTQGWKSLFALVLSQGDLDGPASNLDPPVRKVLERIIGYAGGAAVTAVLDGDGLDFEEAAAALASLRRHLTTWSPELLKYALQRIEVSRLEQRQDENRWPPPLDHR